MEFLIGIGLTIVGLAILQRIVICILYNIEYFALASKSTHITTILDQKGSLIVGYIVSTLFQGGIVLFTFSNLFLSDPVVNTWYVLTCMSGHFIFDLVDMMRYKDGRAMYLIHGHHVLSIALLVHFQLNPMIVPTFTKNIITFLLELSGASVNIRNLCKRCFPLYSRYVNDANSIIYFVTRIVIFPIVVYTHIYEKFLENRIFDLVYMAPSLGFILIHMASLFWFLTMTRQPRT